MVQKIQHQRFVEVFHGEFLRRLFQRVGGVTQQQLDGIAVGQKGIGGQAFLDRQVMAEKPLHEVGRGGGSWGSSLGFDVLQVVVVETAIDLFQQLRGSLQVDLGGLDIHVAHIGGQPGEPGVDVLPVPIPGQQAMNRKRVPQIVNARAGGLGGGLPHCLKRREGGMDGARGAGGGICWFRNRGESGERGAVLQPLVQVLSQGLAGSGAQGHPAGLAELAFGDIEALLRRGGSPPGSKRTPRRCGFPCCTEAPEGCGRCGGGASSAAAVPGGVRSVWTSAWLKI